MKSRTRWVIAAALVAVSASVAGLATVRWFRDGVIAAEVDRATIESPSEPSNREPLRPEPGQARVVGYGHVDIETGATPLAVPIMGQVADVLVREGDEVKEGQPLIRLESSQAEARLMEARAAVREATVKCDQARRAPQDHTSRIRQQEQMLAAATARIEAQRRQLERLEKLLKTNSVPEENVQSAEDRLTELQAVRTVEQLRLDQLRLEKPEETVALAEANLTAAKAKLASAEDALARHTFRAPDAGKVLRLIVNKGQLVGAPGGGVSVWFCADKPRVVRCEIDQEFANRVSIGMPAEIHDDGTHGTIWRGTVQRIGDWIATRRSMLDEPFQRNDVRTLECLVAIDPGQPPVRIGQRLRVVLREASATTKQLAQKP